MSLVQLSDAIIPEVYTSYTAVDTPELTAFFMSGAVIRNPLIDQFANSGGKMIHIPFWNDIDPNVEPNYSSDDPAQLSTPGKINSGEQVSRIAYLNKSMSAADLVSELAGSDPMQRIRNRFGTYWVRQWQRRVLATAVGLWLENVANDSGDMVIDISIQDGNNAGAGNVFNRSAFVDAAFTMGDLADTVRAIAVHSIVYKRMTDNDDIEFIPDSKGQLTIPTYLGRTVIVDDGMPVIAGTTSGFRYVSILFGAAAVGYGEGNPRVPAEIFRHPDQGNGGGVETLYERKTWIVHPGGYKWNEATLDGGVSPALSDLRKPARWTRVVPRKNVPLAFLITNG